MSESEEVSDEDAGEEVPERQSTLIVRMPTDVYDEYRAKCADQDRSIAAQTRRLIADFLGQD